ncbi:MAG: hypothetical protein N2257_05705 [Thermodesulfovibrionales bacterium]|nr:hypothetical protein [Thermodesulfovibrionales bacterium]
MNSKEIAVRLKELLIEISPLIEEYTSYICPLCQDVCCKQKHAIPEEKDLIYMKLTGIPEYTLDGRGPEENCQFLGEKGCIKPRWQRPLRCTWYFCSSLLRAMDEGDQKKARKLTELIRDMVELSGRLRNISLNE